MSSIADSSGGRAHGLSVQNRTDLPDTLDTSTGKIYKVRREDGDEYKAVIELTKLIGADPEVP